MELSIIILNYRTKGLLKQCLRGIELSQLQMPYEVLVVDNNSRDGSIEMVAEFFPWAKRLPLTTNGGFAVGNNAGIRQAQGKYVMILNPDVAVFKGAADSLLAYMNEHLQVGIAVPKLINPDGTVQMSAMRFPNFTVPVWRRTPLGKLPIPQNILRRYHMAEWDHKDNRPIGWALGACLLMRRTAIDAVGMFDEQFFLYLEDVDLCRRMWAKQWEIHYVAQAEMVHFHQRLSATAAVLTSMFSYAARIHIKSWLQYFKKYSGQPQPPAEFCL